MKHIFFFMHQLFQEWKMKIQLQHLLFITKGMSNYLIQSVSGGSSIFKSLGILPNFAGLLLTNKVFVSWKTQTTHFIKRKQFKYLIWIRKYERL